MKKFKFSNIIVILAVIHIDLFVLAVLYIGLQNGTVSDSLVTCFFSWWGIEVLGLAGIKVGKLKYNAATYEENLEEEVTDE